MRLLKAFDKFHTWSNSLIKNRLPILSLYYYTKPRIFLYKRTQPLHKLLKGTLENTCTKKSVLFFTVHKSASTFFSRYLTDVAKQSGHIHIDVNGYFVGQGAKGVEKQNETSFKQKAFKKNGFIYGPLRNFIAVPELENYPVVLVLRDPRDVLTSQYFSIKNTHPMLTPELIKRRKTAQSSTIDEHALGPQSDRFVKTYTEYITVLLNKPNVLFIKYEEIISDFKNCMIKINNHCELGLTPEQLILLDRSELFKTKKEDQTSHIRKIKSGDHKEKLKPETIEALNKKFEFVLKELGY